MKVSGYVREVCVALVFLTAAALPQGIKPINIVEIQTGSTVQRVTDELEVTLSIHLTIKKGWHINAHWTNDPYLIPTAVQLDSSNRYSVKTVTYPPAENIKLQFSENELALYEEDAVITATVIVDKIYAKDSVALKGFVQYQPCNDQTCLFPVKKPFMTTVKF